MNDTIVLRIDCSWMMFSTICIVLYILFMSWFSCHRKAAHKYSRQKCLLQKGFIDVRVCNPKVKKSASAWDHAVSSSSSLFISSISLFLSSACLSLISTTLSKSRSLRRQLWETHKADLVETVTLRWSILNESFKMNQSMSRNERIKHSGVEIQLFGHVRLKKNQLSRF